MAETTAQPKYVQLAAQLRAQIRSGELKAGDRLPSYAEMYRRFGATPATAQRVCDLLEQENLIERRGGSGIYVAELRKRTPTGHICVLWRTVPPTTGSSVPFVHLQMLLAGIRQACREHQLEILLVSEYEAEHSAKTDGVIIFSNKLEAYAMGIPEGTPHVLIGQHADGITSIKIDDFSGGMLATSHLIENGHQRIACFIEGVFDETLQRAAGYQAALAKAGITADPRWLKQTPKIDLTTGYLEWGRQMMARWLKDDWQLLECTAIVTQNDLSAIGAMQALQDAGIKVPEEISVIGFDASICDMARPQLTSVQVPFYQMGYEAVQALREQIEHGTQAPRDIILPVTLSAGDSVYKINEKGAKNVTPKNCR